MDRILIIEDDRALAQAIADHLQAQGAQPLLAHTAAEGLRRLREGCEVCILDIGLPDGDGFSLCRQARAFFAGPILMLTGHDAEDDIVRGLQLGADDYVPKPVSLRVLWSRVSAQLRRAAAAGAPQALLYSGALTIDPAHRTVLRAGEALALGATEFALCLLLAQSGGRILPRDTLLDALWDARERFVEDNTLSVHVSRLRHKLGLYEGVPYIETVKGIGYRWCADVRRSLV